MAPFRFVQLSDVHLGAHPFARHPLLSDLTPARIAALHTAFDTAVSCAKENVVDAILIPGDLFDAADPPDDPLNAAIDLLEKAAPIPVVIVPGNHDPTGADSPWSPDGPLMRSRGRRWGDHVQIVTSRTWQRVELPDRPDVCLMTRSFHDVDRDRDPLEGLPSKPDGTTGVLMFHGSQMGGAPPGDEGVVGPFSTEKLSQVGYDYAAVGHYHSCRHLVQGGSLLGGYSGCLLGQTLSETGAKGFLLVGLQGDTAVKESDVVFCSSGGGDIVRLEADVGEITHQKALLDLVGKALVDSNIDRSDIVIVELSGLIDPSVDLTTLLDGELNQLLHADCARLIVSADDVRPDYGLELDSGLSDIDGSSVEAEFKREMLNRFRDNSDGPENQEIIRRALYYGLDALSGGQVRWR